MWRSGSRPTKRSAPSSSSTRFPSRRRARFCDACSRSGRSPRPGDKFRHPLREDLGHARPTNLPAPPHWMPYVAVPDVDATVRQAQGLGARVYVPPRDIPVGRFATLADPQGATFSVYKPAPASSPPPDTDDVKVGGFSWHELVTTDWKRAWDFYRALFGWEHSSSMEMGPGNTYWMFKRGGGTTMLGGMYNKSAEAPPHWLCYVLVPNADRAAETAARAGGKIVMGPMEVPGGDRIAGGLDPQGAAFAVHARAAQAVRPPAKKNKAPAKKTKARKTKPKRRR